MDKSILDLAEKLKTLRNTKTNVEDEVKYLNGEIEKVMTDLSELMADNELPSFTHSGFTYSLATRTFASPLAGSKEALFDALRENGYGGLITETVNANTLSSTVSELIELNGGVPDWLVGKVNTYDKVSVRIAKSTKKS
jgi:hypothetical protein